MKLEDIAHDLWGHRVRRTGLAQNAAERRFARVITHIANGIVPPVSQRSSAYVLRWDENAEQFSISPVVVEAEPKSVLVHESGAAPHGRSSVIAAQGFQQR